MNEKLAKHLARVALLPIPTTLPDDPTGGLAGLLAALDAGEPMLFDGRPYDPDTGFV